jgi:hypothetical protein
VRLAILTGMFSVLLCGAAFGQGSLQTMLMLTPSQTEQVFQLNSTLSGVVNTKQNRSNQVNRELTAEFAKAQPDARALGDRYLELASLANEIAAARASTQMQITALLNAGQKTTIQQISTAVEQRDLIAEATCAYLANPIISFPPSVPVFISSSNGAFGFGVIRSFFQPVTCQSRFPVSIRNLLALTDEQVAGITGLQAAFTSLYARKQSRIADVQVEIRDLTAQASPDAAALGVRYAELGGISRELTDADTQTRAAARALLTSSQQSKLQTILDESKLAGYILPAESCHFISPPPGTQGVNFSEFSCSSSF